MAQTEDERADTPGERGTLILRDPVHDYFVLPSQLEGLLAQWPIHRLRRIAQTSMANIQYPSLTGTRFEHSLGTMHLARTAWREAWGRFDESDDPKAFIAAAWRDLRSKPTMGGTRLDKFTSDWVANEFGFRNNFVKNVDLALAAAGLLHDLGHPPYSHALEGFFARNMNILIGTDAPLEELREAAHLGVSAQFHEIAGLHLARSLNWNAVPGISRELVIRILIGGEPNTWIAALHEMISGEIDVDRIDYIVRDANRAGVEFGAIDSARLFQSLKIRAVTDQDAADEMGWRLGYEYRARSAIETFLTNRIRYYQWVLFHYRVVAANKFLEEALEELMRIESSTPLNANDSNISAILGNLRPNLAYFGGPKQHAYPLRGGNRKGGAGMTEVRDSDGTATSAEVDDGVVQVWLTEAARRARAIRTSKVSTAHSRSLAKFESLYSAIFFRDQNWTSLWEDEADFVLAAETMRPDLISALEVASQNISEIAASNTTAAASFLNLEIINLTNIMNELEADAGRGLNLLAERLLYTVPNESSDGAPIKKVDAQLWEYVAQQPSLNVRKAAERRLQDHLSAAPLQPGGIGVEWVVSFQSTSAVKKNADAVAIFKGETTGRIGDFSAMAQALNEITARYPRIFAFAVIPGGMKQDLQTLKPIALDHFVEKFPAWVDDEYRLFALNAHWLP